jgi:hypothetical protein
MKSPSQKRLAPLHGKSLATDLSSSKLTSKKTLAPLDMTSPKNSDHKGSQTTKNIKKKEFFVTQELLNPMLLNNSFSDGKNTPG